MADSGVSAAGPVDADLCAPFLTQVRITGAAVSMFGGTATETLVCASDPLAVRIDELQFDLGEGPRWEVLRTRLPVLVPDVHDTRVNFWPVFSKAVMATDAAALFVFPLTVGALSLGVVELHRTEPGNLSQSDQAATEVLAGQTAWQLLRWVLSVNSPDTDPAVETALMSRREIHQATGMVLAQSGVSAVDALLLMRAHAFANALTLRETADKVLLGHLSFAPRSDHDPHGNGGLE